jgi:hypothetical protein
MRWERHVAHMGERRGEYGVVVGKPEGKPPLVRPVCGWVDNTRNDLKINSIGWRLLMNVPYDRGYWRVL